MPTGNTRPGDGGGGYDVVFTYKWGGPAGHHVFKTKAEAEKFAAEYRKGVYSTADGTLTSVNIVPVGGGDRVASAKGGNGKVTYDDFAAKGKSGTSGAYNPPPAQTLPKWTTPTPARPSWMDRPSPATSTPSVAAKNPLYPVSSTASKGQPWWKPYAKPTAKATVKAWDAYDKLRAPYDKAKSYADKAEKWIDRLGGDWKVPHPSIAGAKVALRTGLDYLEKLVVSTGDSKLDRINHAMFEWLREALSDPKDVAKDRLKEGLREYGNRP